MAAHHSRHVTGGPPVIVVGGAVGGVGGGSRGRPQPRAETRARGGEEEESIFKLLTEGAKDAHRKGSTPAGGTTPSGTGAAGRGKLRMHQNSSQIAGYLNPHEYNKREAKVDYTKANRTAVKDASSMNAIKKMNDAVESENIRPGAPVMRRQNSGAAAPGTSFGGPRHAPPPPGKGAQPGKDFVRANKSAARAVKPAPQDAKADEHQKLMKKQDYGKVPAYLKARQREMAEEEIEREAAIEAAKIPPGMRVMPESERMDTLQILAQNKAAVEDQISKLPFTVETPSQIKYKDGLHRRLQEIEEAERLFSRPNVLVHI
mmetsp:Transcript_6685/g.17060  ORF Transcript_6685/g.17060 Transcript_6685/m.17060 type:complete len:317 (+) Transcript_6685:224-1174(+)